MIYNIKINVKDRLLCQLYQKIYVKTYHIQNVDVYVVEIQLSYYSFQTIK